MHADVQGGFVKTMVFCNVLWKKLFRMGLLAHWKKHYWGKFHLVWRGGELPEPEGRPP